MMLAPLLHAQGIGTVNVSTKMDFLSLIKTSTGKYVGFGNDNTTANRVISQFDAAFNEEWTLAYPSAEVLSVRSIVELNDGNYACLIPTQNNGSSVAVMKITPAGTVVFVKEYQFALGSMNAYAFSAAAPGDNGYIFGGGLCAIDNYLIKCDVNGDVEWVKAYMDTQFSGGQTVFGIVSDASGYTMASTYNDGVDRDANLWRVNTTGALQWSKLYTSPGTKQEPVKLLKKSDGSFAMICAEETIGNDDFIYFLNATGTTATLVKYEGPIQYEFVDATLDASDNIWYAAYSYSNTTNRNSLAVLNLSPTGTINWSKLSKIKPNAISATPGPILQTPSGNMALCASTSAFQTRGTVSIVDNAGQGLCTESALSAVTVPMSAPVISALSLTVSSPTVNTFNLTPQGTTFVYDRSEICGQIVANETAIAKQPSILYPNPSNGRVTLENPNGFQNGTLHVFNTAGAKVRDFSNLEGTLIDLDFQDLPTGLYLLNIEIDDQIETLRFVKQ